MKNKYFFKALIVTSLLLLFGTGQILAQEDLTTTPTSGLYFLSFDGLNDYAKYPDNSVLEKINGSASYTLEAWVYVANDANDSCEIYHRDKQFKLYYQKANKNLGVGIYSSGWKYYCSKDSTLTTGTWHHIAVVRNDTLAHYFHIYIDGTDQISTDNNAYVLSDSDTNNFYIGNDGNNSHYFKGYIDEIRLENIAVNDSNIQAHVYDNQYGADSNTIALFHFNEGQAQFTANEVTGVSANLGSLDDGDDAEPGWETWDAIDGHHLPLAHEWTGVTDTNWNTSGNWVGDIPTPENDVIIPAGLTSYPVISVGRNADCHNLTIKPGAHLTVASDSTGNGSLIVSGTPVGLVTVQRYITTYTAGNNGWHEIGSPVNSMTISGSDFEPGTTHPNLDDFYAWDESDNIWLNYKDSDNNISHFDNGQGYLVAYETTGIKSFTGTLNNANVIFHDLSITTDKGNGWHLLGNPFPSALKWGDNNWDLDHIAHTAKVWKETIGNYLDISPGDIIPSTSGFFVQVYSDIDSDNNTTSLWDNSIAIPKGDRTYNSTNNYKTSQIQEKTLKFKVTNDANQYYDLCTLGFKAEATDSCDNAFDSHKLFTMVKTAPSLWTVSHNEDFSTNYLPEITSARDVPIDFKPGVSTVYHLTIQGADSFKNTSLILEDLKTGDKIDLNNSDSYDFSANNENDIHRFTLHINGTTDVYSKSKAENIQIFSYGSTVYLHGQKVLSGKVSIFNTLGQKVYEGPLNKTNRQKISLNQQSGIYFVRMEENGHVFTKKIFIY